MLTLGVSMRDQKRASSGPVAGLGDLLATGAGLRLLALRNIKHGAHPACVLTVRINQWCFIDQCIEMLAILAPEAEFETFTGGLSIKYLVV